MAVTDELGVLFSTFVTSLVIVYALRSFAKKKNDGRLYPPAFPSLPFVGSLPFLGDFDGLPRYLLKKSLELGPIFTVKIFSRETLILNSREAIVDAVIKHSSSFSGREGLYADKNFVNTNMKGIISRQTGPHFRKLQTLTLNILKEFGFGVKNLMEERILVEAEKVVEYVKQRNGKSFDPQDMAVLASSNIIKSIVIGKRCAYDTANGMDEISTHIHDWIRNMDITLEVAPILKYLPHKKKRIQRLTECHAKLLEALETEYKVISNGGNEDCFVRRFLEKEGSGHDHEDLLFLMRDLLAAGTDTTASSLRYLFIFLANHPHIQEQVFDEIDSVLPKGRVPSLSDKQKMPYMEATLMEIWRIETIGPFAAAHVALTDTKVDKYFVPAGTIVLLNLYAVHMNPKVWGDPEVFRPERFLDKDKKVVGTDKMMPFSLGKRSCLGEVLAHAEFFLLSTILLQHFRVDPPEGQRSIEYTTTIGQASTPSAFQVRFTPRNK